MRKTTASKQIVPVAHGELVTPSPRRPGGLKSLENVRFELAKVYRDARDGTLDLSDACKLGYLLVSLGKLIEGSELSARLEAVERELTRAGGVR